MYCEGFRGAALKVYAFLRSIRKTCKALSIAKSTLVRWKTSGNLCVKRRTPSSAFHSNQCMKSLIQDYIATNPFCTQLQLRAFLFKKTGVRVSRQLLSVALRKWGMSKVKTRVVHGNAQRQIPRIREFLESLLECMRDSGRIVAAIDECGFDNRLLPKKGYCKRGRRLRVPARCSGGWNRHNMILSVSNTGDNHCCMQRQPVDQQSFAHFIQELPYPEGSILIMDNVAFHKTKAVLGVMEKRGYVPLFIPPYCPDANPVENVFGMMKNAVRTQWASVAAAEGNSLTDADFLDVVETVAAEIASALVHTPQKIFNHAIQWMQREVERGD